MTDIWENKKWTPMLLEEIYKPFNDEDYYFEIKFDGFRALIFASPNKVYIQSRNGTDLTDVYPELQSIRKIVKKKVIFDGEIISTINGIPSFSKLQKRSRIKNKNIIKMLSKEDPVIFMAFDILYEDQNITNEKLYKRKKRLNKYKDTDTFIKTKIFEKNGINLFKEVKKMKLEGIVAKNKNGTYHINERTNDFIKIKNMQREEFVIGGYIEKENTLSILLGEYKNKKLYFVGKVSVGKKNEISKKLLATAKTKNNFVDFNENAKYVKPNNTCFVEYLEKTKQGHLRHPILKEYR
ncbi:MAG: hypothetical protein ACI31M_00550 [Bacilli bacterium]